MSMSEIEDVQDYLFVLNDLSQGQYERDNAAYQLGELGDISVMPDLIRILGSDPSGVVRASCARALGSLGDKRGAPALAQALSDPDNYVRGNAAYSLGRVGEHTSIPALTVLLGDPRELVR